MRPSSPTSAERKPACRTFASSARPVPAGVPGGEDRVARRPSAARSPDRSARSASAASSKYARRALCPASGGANGSRTTSRRLGEQRRRRRRRRRPCRASDERLEQVVPCGVGDASSRLQVLQEQLADPVGPAAAHHQHPSPARTSPASQRGGRLDGSRAPRPGSPGARARDGAASPPREAIVVSGSRPGPDVRDRDARPRRPATSANASSSAAVRW